MKRENKARLMQVTAMATFGTLPLFVRNISVASAELALYRAILASVIIGVFLLVTRQKIPFRSIRKTLPLFLLSWKKLGRSFFFKTMFATVVISLMLDATAFLPTFLENKLLAAVAGGVCAGAGLGIIFSRGMATGGTDLLAKLIKGWFRGVSYGKVILIADGVILVIAAVAYQDLWSILYSAITVWLSSTVIDTILNGMERAKSVSIITNKKDEVLQGILQDVNRGATVWNAEGGYTKAGKDVVLVVVRSYELFHLKRTVRMADPEAFMIVSDATEVLGNGFQREESK